ncbi:MAG: hypothetical protein AAF193_10570, partial [Bacteroidota bacterium]
MSQIEERYKNHHQDLQDTHFDDAKMWDGISKELDSKRKRRLPFFFIFGIGAMLGLSIGGWIFHSIDSEMAQLAEHTLKEYDSSTFNFTHVVQDQGERVENIQTKTQGLSEEVVPQSQLLNQTNSSDQLNHESRYGQKASPIAIAKRNTAFGKPQKAPSTKVAMEPKGEKKDSNVLDKPGIYSIPSSSSSSSSSTNGLDIKVKHIEQSHSSIESLDLLGLP